jgi:tryptophan 2,3-dioxygenase
LNYANLETGKKNVSKGEKKMMEKEIQNSTSPIRNEQGIIAEQYSQLQALHVLEQAKAKYPLPKGSVESVLRTILQATEIALLNMVDLIAKATKDVKHKQFGAAEVKISWLRGIHYLMVQLSTMPQQIGVVSEKSENSRLSIVSSPAYREYFEHLKQFDAELSACIRSGEIPIDFLLATQTLDNTLLHLIHLIRICNHETTIWEYNLQEVAVPIAVTSYEEFVACNLMRNAAYDTTLQGDTYYQQFRGLHQIPEILCAEVNDHIEATIMYIRVSSLQRAYENLRYITLLSRGIAASLQPMTDCLATSDYHAIRENLGLTSGSHSVNIHYHLFRDLYTQLWDAFAQYILNTSDSTDPTWNIENSIRQIDQRRFDDTNAFLVHLLANDLLKLRSFIQEWRNSHLHLPRNNVSGSYTKSLTGSPDAVQAVKKMRDTAIMRDPLYPLATARKLGGLFASRESLLLTSYFNLPQSLDNQILDHTGKITKERFKHVQERTGIFAQKSPFIPPPRREV